jgi:hypothetical protein
VVCEGARGFEVVAVAEACWLLVVVVVLSVKGRGRSWRSARGHSGRDAKTSGAKDNSGLAEPVNMNESTCTSCNDYARYSCYKGYKTLKDGTGSCDSFLLEFFCMSKWESSIRVI